MKTSLLLITQLFFISSLFSEVRAIYNDDKVEISWTNPLYIEVDYFVIERSKNGKNFKKIMKIDGSKSNKINIEYYEIDYNPFNKKAYYRIRQVHVNGRVNYSNIVVAEKNKNVKSIFGLFSKSKKNKHLKGYSENDVLVVLIDAKQSEYIAVINVKEENKELIITYSNVYLPTGVYLIIATSDDVIYGNKINVASIYFKQSAYTLHKE
ncbi:MAG: hypothetical protein COA97_12585 [Flavobacteriales bacterium]|nr:MAG: hypothetical protein COA97_12585 [Flavobacteriales bacterium]